MALAVNVGAGAAGAGAGLGATTSLTKEKPARRAAALLSWPWEKLEPSSESLRMGRRAAQTSGDWISMVGM